MRGAAVVALVSSLVLPSGAGAARTDTSGTASRVTITDDGITIRRHDSKTTKVVDIRHPGTTVNIDDGDDNSDSDSLVDVARAHRGGRVHIGGGSLMIDGDDASVVRMFSDVTVAAGEHLEGDVVALFGSVDVKGQVDGSVVAVLGSIRLHPGATIDGDAVAVGGGLDQPEGATVTGESVSLHFLPISPGVPPLRALMLIVLGGWLFAVLSGALLWLVVPQRMVRIAETSVQRTGWSLVVGLMLPPLAVIVGVLLTITVIGIPVAFLLPLFYLLVVWAGQVSSAYLLGCRLMRRPLGHGGPFIPTLVGSLLVSGLFAAGAVFAGPNGALHTLALFLTLLGGLFSLVLSVLGSGAAIVSGLGSSPRPKSVAPAEAGSMVATSGAQPSAAPTLG